MKSQKQAWVEVWELLPGEVTVAWEMRLFVNSRHNRGSHAGFPPFQLLRRTLSRECPCVTTAPQRHSQTVGPHRGAAPVPSSIWSLGASVTGKTHTSCCPTDDEDKHARTRDCRFPRVTHKPQRRLAQATHTGKRPRWWGGGAGGISCNTRHGGSHL